MLRWDENDYKKEKLREEDILYWCTPFLMSLARAHGKEISISRGGDGWLIDWWRAFSMIDALKLEAVQVMHESFVSWAGDFPDTWRGDAERDLKTKARRIASFSVALQAVYCVCVLLSSNYSFIFWWKKILEPRGWRFVCLFHLPVTR